MGKIFLFGPLIARLRAARGMSRRALERASSVPDSYIALMEKGERPPPSPRALHALAEALDCTPEERLLLFERALGDRLLKEIHAYAGYLFLALASPADAERAAALLGEPGRASDAEAVRTLLEAVASAPEYAPMRAWQAGQIFRRLVIAPQDGEVVAQLAPFAASALGAALLHDPEANVRAAAEGAGH